MFLSPDNVAHYLAERRLLSLDSVVDGDFMVVEQSSRNYNFQVVREHSPGFFIKQVRQRKPDLITSFEREAACYRLAQKGERLEALGPLLPTFHHHDGERHVMVLERLADAESLWEYHRRLGGELPLDLAELQGEALGQYHGQISVVDTTGLEIFPRAVPWILSLHESSPGYIERLSRGNAEMIGILRRFPEFPRALGELKSSWRPSVLIHGDIKWENLMLLRRDEGWELRVIDWEMADLGDDAWDVGAIFQSYLSFWIFSLRLGPDMNIAAAAAASPYGEEAMKKAMGAFFASYARRRGLGGKGLRRLRERALSSAAARIIQTAFESMQQAPQITPHALCQLQMAMNILDNPRAAARDLLEPPRVGSHEVGGV